jgi:hypothetical protein
VGVARLGTEQAGSTLDDRELDRNDPSKGCGEPVHRFSPGRSSLSGLLLADVAALRAVEREGGVHHYVATSAVLSHLEHEEGLSPAYALRILRDLGDHRRVNAPLVRHQGDWEIDSDDFQSARVTQVQLTRMGGVVLAAEQGTTGFTPLFMLNGSLYSGGVIPPFAPGRIFGALRLLIRDPATTDHALFAAVGPPSLPSGAVIEGDLQSLYRGHRVPVAIECVIERTETHSGKALDITGLPAGVSVHRMKQELIDLIGSEEDFRVGDPTQVVAPWPENQDTASCPLVGFEDWSSYRNGVRLRLLLASGISYEAAERWVKTNCESARVELEVELPAPLADTLRAWASSIGDNTPRLDAIIDSEQQDSNQRRPRAYCVGDDSGRSRS